MKFLMTIILVTVDHFLFAQQQNQTVQTGNSYYRQQQYDKAESEYRKAMTTPPPDKIAKFNLASSLIKQGRADEANKLLAELSIKEDKPDIRSNAIYDQGVIYTQQKKLEASIESYKQTLRLNPNDQEARENLQKALLELKKKNPPKKQEEKKKKEQQKQQPKPKITPREAQQQLKLLEQKEKQVQERLQKNSKEGGSQPKDW